MARLIDSLMPEWDHAERHEKVVAAPVDRVETTLREFTVEDLPVTRFLFRIRTLLSREELPTKRPFLDAFLDEGFALLGETPGEELALGACGRFWQIRGDGIDPIAGAGEFHAYSRPGSVKAVMNFELAAANGGTRLATETRIAAVDDAGRRAFRRYWLIIMPGSALIRREMLYAVARRAREPR